MLPGHDRYDYHPWSERSVYSWQGGAKLAVYLGISLEHFPFGQAPGTGLAPPSRNGWAPQPTVLSQAMHDYGNRVGAWRLLEMLEALRLPATVLANSALYGHAPALIAAHRARGDEIAAHGLASEGQSTWDEAAERALIQATTATIAGAEGIRPRGWFSPWAAESHMTPDLLAEAGYTYTLNWCADDQPVWMRTRSRRLLAVPYPQEINDITAILGHHDGAERFAAMIIADFEERLQQIRDGKPQVMGIALHPFIVGRPYRLRALRAALEHITARQGLVWIATAGQIADHVASLSEGVVP